MEHLERISINAPVAKPNLVKSCTILHIQNGWRSALVIGPVFLLLLYSGTWLSYLAGLISLMLEWEKVEVCEELLFTVSAQHDYDSNSRSVDLEPNALVIELSHPPYVWDSHSLPSLRSFICLNAYIWNLVVGS